MEIELLLAAGKLVGIAVEVELHAEMSDETLRACARSAFGQLHQLERILDVVDRAQPREQRLAVVLEHIAELDVAQRLAVEQDFAGIERDQARDHVDQRALAAAVRPEHRDELAARDVEIEAVIDDGVVEALAKPADGDVSAACSSPRGQCSRLTVAVAARGPMSASHRQGASGSEGLQIFGNVDLLLQRAGLNRKVDEFLDNRPCPCP